MMNQIKVLNGGLFVAEGAHASHSQSCPRQ